MTDVKKYTRGKGWMRPSFVVSASELKDLLDGYILTDFGIRVAKDYYRTPLEEYIRIYEKFLSRIFSEPMWNHRVDYPYLEGLQVSVSLNVDFLNFKPIADSEFKISEPVRPPVVIQRAQIYFDHEKKNHSLTTLNNEGIIGLQMQYPSVACYTSNDSITEVKADQFPEYQIFKSLDKEIQIITKPATFLFHEQKIKSKLRISPSMFESVRNHPYFRQEGVSVL